MENLNIPSQHVNNSGIGEENDKININVQNIGNIKSNQTVEYYEGIIEKHAINNTNHLINILQLYHDYIKENKKIIKKGGFLKRHVIKHSRELNNKLFLVDPEEIKNIVGQNIRDMGTLKRLLLSLYYYMKSKKSIDKINIQNYIYENLEQVNYEIGSNIHKTYKQSPQGSTPYTGKQNDFVGPFSLIDLKTEAEINSIQVSGKEIPIGEQIFYSINDRIPVKLQLIINRLFAPYIGMTRLIKIQNESESQVVSIDVNHKDAEQILGYKENTPENIQDLLRIIYQFIALDNDRRKKTNHNIENNIIYDFEGMGTHDFIDFTDRNHINLAFKKDQYKEVAKIIYFFKSYIYSTSKKEILRLKNEKENGQKIDNEILNFWKKLYTQSRMLNMINIICGCRKEELVDMALSIDAIIKEYDEENT